MPLKIGKSKSSSGTELVNVHNPSNDEIIPPKKKGFKKFFMQKSKIPTKQSSDDNQIKYKDKPSEICETPVNNSPMRATCHSVSPKLYTNSCASSTEELTNFGGSNNQNCQSNAAVSPIRDVIIEEDYEDALTVNDTNNSSQKPTKLSSNIPLPTSSPPIIPPKNLSLTPQNSNTKTTITVNSSITATTTPTSTSTTTNNVNSGSKCTLTDTSSQELDNTIPYNNTPTINTFTNDGNNSKECKSTVQNDNNESENQPPQQQSIYNVPVDALQNKNTMSNKSNNNGKEIIETYRLSQITPTNQFNDIRSRCCSDADSLPVHHSDLGGVTSRGSTGSSPISSAHTLSESPAVYPHPISSQLASSCTSSTTASPQQHQTSTNEIKDVPQTAPHNSVNSLSHSRHAKQQPQYNNSPKGNTVICHHPSSPFAPPSASITTIPSKSSTPSPKNQVSNLTNNTPSTTPMVVTAPVTNPSNTSNLVSRRPGRLNKQNSGIATNQSQDNHCDNESSMLVNEIRNLTEQPVVSNHKSLKEINQQQPIYEEAWDVKIHKLFQDKQQQQQQQANNNNSSPGIISMIQRPQSAVSGATEHKNILSSQLAYLNRTSSPNNTSSTNNNSIGPTRNTTTPQIIPPAVPPHRRSSDHIKSTTLFMPPTAISGTNSNSRSIARSSSTQLPLLQSHTNTSSVVKKHAINPAFQDHQCRQNVNKGRHDTCSGAVATGDDAAGSDYDYAYNDTWSMGVKMTMNCNLSSNHDDSSSNSQKLSGSRGNRHSLTSQPPPSSHHLATNHQYLDKIDSVESESSPGDSSNSSCISATPTTATASVITKSTALPVPNNKNLLSPGIRSASSNSGGGGGGVDNDSWSNDSYEEPWDIRHGRVFQELTSTRLVDPTSVLSSVTTTAAVATTTSNPCAGVARQLSSSTVVSSTVNNTGVGNRNRSVSGNSINNATSRSVSCNNPSVGSSTSNSSLVNINIPLEDQPWYHDQCTRVDAENLMALAPEGSFLVRKSETCRNNFSLTIKHRNEYLHMKISQNQSGYILGQYSQPYVSIPHMLQHYSLSMVPVKGAPESVVLINPVTR